MPAPSHRRAARPLAAVAVVALTATLAGCTSSASTATGPATRATGDRGGTLQVLAAAGAVNHLDPQRMRTPAEADLGRLLYRGLTAFPTTAGDRHAVPDLAAGPGRPSDDATTWTFTLRRGMRFQDGSVITSADVRRGVERAFIPAFGGAPAYLTDVLDCGKAYAGPPSGDCPAIDTPDPDTVVFHLRMPVGDFPDVVALPAFLPVPGGDDLDTHPVASGPYQVADYQPGQRLVLERNQQWQAASDPVRPALPDRVEVSLGQNPDDVVRRLSGPAGGSDGDDATAVPLGVALPVTSAGPTADDKSRLDRGFDDGVDALALNTTVPPLDNVAVRTALIYAVSRTSYRDARGGAAAGAPATTLLSPALPAYRSFDLWHAPADGDVQKATTALSRAGYPNGFTVTLDDSGDAAGARAVIAALQRAGVTVQLAKPGQQPVGMTLVHLVPDRPAAVDVLRPLLCTCGSHNVSHYASSDVDSRIDAAEKLTTPADAEQAWAEVDMRALQDVPIIPLLHRQVTRVHGAKVGNARLSPMYGEEYDLAALSVS